MFFSSVYVQTRWNSFSLNTRTVFSLFFLSIRKEKNTKEQKKNKTKQNKNADHPEPSTTAKSKERFDLEIYNNKPFP
jgi:hypothetical protein